MGKTPEAVRRPRTEFPFRDRCTVSGLVVGHVCFTCRCRIVELDGEDGIVLAWCECAWPEDHHEMEVL